MDEAVSVAEADCRFSQLLLGVRQGRSYVVIDRGEPVARLIPMAKRQDLTVGARGALLSRLEKQPVGRAEKCLRDDLYEDGP